MKTTPDFLIPANDVVDTIEIAGQRASVADLRAAPRKPRLPGATKSAAALKQDFLAHYQFEIAAIEIATGLSITHDQIGLQSELITIRDCGPRGDDVSIGDIAEWYLDYRTAFRAGWFCTRQEGGCVKWAHRDTKRELIKPRGWVPQVLSDI